MAIENILLVGTQAEFDALTPDSSKLYFCSDSKSIYKGTDLYTDSIRAVSVRPDTPAVNKLYYNTTSESLEYYDGSDWVTVDLAIPIVTSISDASTDEEIPSAKLLYDLIEELNTKISELEAKIESLETSTVSSASIESLFS